MTSMGRRLDSCLMLDINFQVYEHALNCDCTLARYKESAQGLLALQRNKDSNLIIKKLSLKANWKIQS